MKNAATVMDFPALYTVLKLAKKENEETEKTEAVRTWAYKNTVGTGIYRRDERISGLLLHRKDEE